MKGYLIPALLATFVLLASPHVGLLAQSPQPTKDLPSNQAEFEQEYQARIKKERLNGIYIPKDLAEATEILQQQMDLKAKAAFASFTEDEVKRKGMLRMRIINNWGFYGGSRLSHAIREMGVTHPEDMAELIMITMHRVMRKEDLKIKEQVAFYKNKRKSMMEERLKKAKVLKEETIVKPKE